MLCEIHGPKFICARPHPYALLRGIYRQGSNNPHHRRILPLATSTNQFVIPSRSPSMRRIQAGLALIVTLGSVSLYAADTAPKTEGRGSAASDWPQWRGTDRSGISPDTGLNTDWTARPPKLLWTAEGLGGGFASVSLVGNVI